MGFDIGHDQPEVCFLLHLETQSQTWVVMLRELGCLEYLGHNIMAMEEHGAEDCVLDFEEEGHGSDGGGSELASSVDTLLDNTYFDDEDLNEEQTCKRCVTIFTKYKGRTDFFRPHITHKLIFCPY